MSLFAPEWVGEFAHPNRKIPTCLLALVADHFPPGLLDGPDSPEINY